MNKYAFVLMALLPLSAQLSAAQSPVIQGVLRFHGNLVEGACDPSRQASQPVTGKVSRCQTNAALNMASVRTTGAADPAIFRELWQGGVVVVTHE